MRGTKSLICAAVLIMLVFALSACDKSKDKTGDEAGKDGLTDEAKKGDVKELSEAEQLTEKLKAANICQPKDYGCKELKDLKLFLRARKLPLTLEEFRSGLEVSTLDNARAELIRRIAPKATPDLLPVVKPYLTHENFSLRKASLALVSNIGNDAAITELVALLDNQEKSDTLRTDVPKLLMQHPENEQVKASLPKLKDMAKNSVQGWGRAYAATAVAVIEGEASLEFLVDIATNDKWNTVRATAVKSMGRIGSSKALPYLQKFTTDDDKKVAEAAKRAVQKIKGESQAPEKGNSDPSGNVKK